MRLDVTERYLAEIADGRHLDFEGGSPSAVYHYVSDNPDDGIGPNGVTVAIFVTRAAISDGGNWVWGDFYLNWTIGAADPVDELLDRYLAGDWGDEEPPRQGGEP